MTDPPSSPGKPAITDYDKDYVELKWDKPRSDGGSPIKSYIVQMKPKFGDWTNVRISYKNI